MQQSWSTHGSMSSQPEEMREFAPYSTRRRRSRSLRSQTIFWSGFVNSLARPDGNTTGVNILGREGDGKRQDILIEAVPGLRRMATLADVTTDPPLDALQEGARAHNVDLSIYRIARAEEIAAAVD